MKNNPKSALGSIVIATTLLGGHTYMKDVHSQVVHQILCEKQGNEETIWSNTGIVISNHEGYCYISPNNIGFRDLLIKVKEKKGFNNFVAFPILSHKNNPRVHLIKIDG
ncbi:hypothetical protein K2X92_01970, partial [Candidatus Gracilibacteria bacterium]|nr:hypothetical protein [Candidatus Gracilibacteria bacterium]